MLNLAFAATVLASVAAAKTIPIAVGKDGLTFSPNSTKADQGDILEFNFYAVNHTVTQGSFSTPCEVGDLESSFFSGFMPTNGTSANSETFQVTVNDTTPLWIFCSQAKPKSHCQAGMVMVVNQAPGNKTLEVYAANAKAVNNASEVPNGGKVMGGVIATATSNSTSSGGASSTSASPSGTSTGGAIPMGSMLDMTVVGAVAAGAVAFGLAL